MWNYRIIKRPNKAYPSGFEYGIHEVYYNKPKKPHSWSLEPVDLGHYEDATDLGGAIRMIARDFQQAPVLELKGKKLVEVKDAYDTIRLGQNRRKAKSSKGTTDKS